MVGESRPNIEASIARCRVVLSVSALVAVYIDPAKPVFTRWFALAGGSFEINAYALATMSAHLLYSLAMVYMAGRTVFAPERLASVSTWLDVLFSTAIAGFTEGINSPFYVFFAFAVVETGLRAGLRRTLLVTFVSVAIYLSLILISVHGHRNVYVMRPVYLVIMGYMIGYLGERRLNLEAAIRELAVASQRQQIARDLHDGRAQAFAGITLKLQSCQELLRRGRSSEALHDLTDLETSVNQEYDQLRGYMRSLVDIEAPSRLHASLPQTRFSIAAQFNGSYNLVEQVLRILGEGIANVARHAGAREAAMSVSVRQTDVLITIDHDGMGFPDPAQKPWSIASRVSEIGGHMEVVSNHDAGSHLSIRLPWS